MININSPESVQRQFFQDSHLYMTDFGVWFGRLMTRLTKDEEETKLFNVKKFIEEFYNIYNYFREDYKKINKLDFGSFNVLEVVHNGEMIRLVIEVFPGNSLLPKGGKVTMYEDYKEVKMITEPKVENQEIEVDEETIRSYLNLFVTEYGLLFDFISSLKKKCKFSEINDESISISCQSRDSDLDKIRIHLYGNADWGIMYTFDIYFDLLEGKIDYKNSAMQQNDYAVPITNDKIVELIYNLTRISRDNLLIDIKPLEEFFNRKRSEKNPFVDEEKNHVLKKTN